MMINVRAEKTTKNRDDFRVLMAGIMIAIFLMVGFPTLHQIWDRYFADRPFISATIKIVPPQNPGEELRILYDADANKEVSGYWIASIVGEDDVQITTRTGFSTYHINNNDEPRMWTWFAFFDNEKGLNSPGTPIVPFKVCVRYSVEASSGTHDEGTNFCSELYDPRGDK